MKPFCASTFAVRGAGQRGLWLKSKPIGPVCGAPPGAVGASELFVAPVPHDADVELVAVGDATAGWLAVCTAAPVDALARRRASIEEVLTYWPFWSKYA